MTNKGDNVDGAAMALLPEIKSRHEEFVRSEKSSLTGAIRIGELLLEAKEIVGHGKWTDWANEWTGVPTSTRTLCMKLATHKLQITNAVSIREALKSLPKKGQTPKQQQANDRKKTKKAAADLTDLLKNVGPDEVLQALCDGRWENAQLGKLTHKIVKHLEAVGYWKPPKPPEAAAA
jgi:hypothetical protein